MNKSAFREKESGKEIKHKLLEINYEEMQQPIPVTRNSPQCSCSFCLIGRKYGGEYLKYKAEIRANIGKKSETESKRICDTCKSEVSPGLAHNCNKTTRRDNLFELVRESSAGTKERVMSRLIDDLCEEQNVSSTSGILELKTRGPKCKTINIGKMKPKNQFSTEDLIKLKTSFSLSDKRILKLATVLRAALQSRKVIEPGLELALKERNFILKDFYHMKMIPTVRKVGKSRTIENKPGFFAKDVPTLIHVLLDLREIDADRHEVLIGADDGQSMLKVTHF